MNTLLTEAADFLSWAKPPSLSSFSEARSKLPVEACRSILRTLSLRLASMTPKRFRHPSGRRFIGIDGLHLIAPRSRDTVRGLNPAKYNALSASHCPQARVVLAVDLLRRLPLDYVLLPKGRSERLGAQRLLEHLNPGDVAVVDRGFPGRHLLGQFLQARVDVVMRMIATQVGSWPEVAAFLRSRKKEAVVEVRIDRKQTAMMRLIRRDVPRGRPARGQKPQTMVVLTSLTTDDGFDRDAILKLYSSRWGVETTIREMKCEFDIERFHARSVAGIEQEIAAVLAWIAFAAAIQLLAEDKLPEGRRVLRTLCFDEAAKVMAAILAGGDVTSALITALENVNRYNYAPRPGRSFPRVRKSPIGRWKNKDAK